MAIADGAGLPIAICVGSASPHETKYVDRTLDARFVRESPERLIGDRAYDSDPLDAKLLAERGIEMIAPNIRTRGTMRRVPQDGRPLRRYCRRWKVERLFAWLFNFRRLVTRYERKTANFLAFVHLACAIILLRHF
jgi:transposase